MDPTILSSENPDTKSSSEEQTQNQLAVVVPSHSPFATVSLSLSISTFLPHRFFTPSKVSTLFSPRTPSMVKILTKASSVTNLFLLSTAPAPAPAPSKISLKSTVSNNPLQSSLSVGPRRPADPSDGGAIRRASIVWFRNDLRVHDNECLNSANNDSMSVLPVYCFDPQDYGRSSSGFHKTGSYKATFLIESVSDLRKNLQEKGSDLIVRIGKPENVLVELAKAIGADAIYAHREVSDNQVKEEEKVESALKDEGVEVKYSWGSTLFHVDDLPFKLEDMPTNYGGFREKVKGLKIRKTVEAIDQLKGMPSRGDVEPGDIPSLTDLGLNANATMMKGGVNAPMVGGETEALQRLKKLAAECQTQSKIGNSKPDSIYGANFTCKISPWLNTGSLSPRAIMDELNETAASDKNHGGGDWLMFELAWRDFFRFITVKCSSEKVGTTAPATCTGAVA